MSTVPTGSATLMGLGPERQEGVPAPGLVGYGPVLPVAAEMTTTPSQSGQVNPSGYGRKGVPGPIVGPVSWGHPLTAAHQLEFFEHLLGRSSKEVLAAGVFRYTFFPSLLGCVNTSFWGLFAKGNLELFLRYGIKFAQMVMAIGNNTEIVAALTGEGLHGTNLGPAVPAAANAGTYTLGPWARGRLASPSAGSAWLRIENLAPLRYKALQSATEPNAAAWTAAATVHDALVVDSEGAWHEVLSSADGSDLGIFTDCNKDPLEIIFPGLAADVANLAVGDVFEIPITWSPPAIAELAAAGCFNSAHWLTEVGPEGGTLIPKSFDSGNWTLGWPITPKAGSGSRYRDALYRSGTFSSVVSLVRPLEDLFFADAQMNQEHIGLRMAWEGRQLGGGFREGIEVLQPSTEVTSSQRPVASEDLIQETISLDAKTNTAGDPPTTIKVITNRDWTPSPQG